MKKQKGITLISLVITIILMLILAGVVITLALGNNGLIGKAKEAKEETNKQTAIEEINLKITNSIMKKYAEEQRDPTLQELANDFCEDNEIEYVELTSKKIASLDKIEIGENKSFFTKLKKYPYEFEINGQLQLANINGKSESTLIKNGCPINIKKIVESDKNTILSYSNENNPQKYIVPENGYYKIECWGASGGNAGSAIGGKGAYTSGIIYLSKNEEIWAYVGEQGKNGVVSGSAMDGTFNGGGPCGGTNAYGTLSTGGGATDIRLIDGEWNNFNSLKSRIMVAAGGGGACRMLGSGSWLNVNGGYGGTDKGENSKRVTTNRSQLYKSNGRNSNIGRAFCK